MSLTWSRDRPAAEAAEAGRAGASASARPSSRQGLHVERAPLPTLREAWLSLENRFESLLPVQTWDHQSAWWRHFRRAREGRTWVARDEDGSVVGIVPLYIEERRFRLGSARVLAPVGHGEPFPTGRIDAIVAPRKRVEIVRAVADALLRDPSWDFADWPDVPEGGVLEQIARSMRAGGRVELRSEVRTAGPSIALPESFESFISELPDETRRRVLTMRARITEELGASWSSAGSDLDVDSALRLAEELGCEDGGRVPSACPARPDPVAEFRRELIRRGVPRGRVTLRVLFARGVPIAALCGTTLGSTFHAERTGFVERVPLFPDAGTARPAAPRAGDRPPESAAADGPAGAGLTEPATDNAPRVTQIGRADLARFVTLDTLERAIAARLDAIDFSASDDGWDAAWSEGAAPVVSLQVIRRGLAQRMAWFRAGMSESPRHVLRFVVGRERFDELESAWRAMRHSLRPPPV